MAKLTYSIEWFTTSNYLRSKFFYSIRALKKFERVQMSEITAKRRYFVFDGTKKTQFVFYGNAPLTKANLVSLIAEF
jgi:hypothetical protein